jgi:hypothetical protein
MLFEQQFRLKFSDAPGLAIVLVIDGAAKLYLSLHPP